MSASTFFRFGGDRRGVSAVEFSITLPMLIALFFGGFITIQAVAISRKVTIATRAMADLTSQYTQLSSTDMTTVMNATTQILAPYDASPISIRISQITVNALGTKATVDWSAVNANSTFTAYKKNSQFVGMPSDMQAMGGTSFLFAEVSYVYTPPVANALGTYTLADSIFMLPRLSTSVTYSGS